MAMRSTFPPARGGRVYLSSSQRRDFAIGEVVEALNERSQVWAAAKVIRSNLDNTFDVRYEDGFEQRNIDLTRIRQMSNVGFGNSFPDTSLANDDYFREGSRVEARFRGSTKWLPGIISKVRQNGSFNVTYDDGETEIGVTSENIRFIGSSYMNGYNDKEFSNSRKLFTEGMRVEAKYRGHGKYYPARIYRVNTNGTYDVMFDYGETVSYMKGDTIRVPSSQQMNRDSRYSNGDQWGKKESYRVGSVVEYISSRTANGGSGSWFTGRITQINSTQGTVDIEGESGVIESNIPDRNVRSISVNYSPRFGSNEMNIQSSSSTYPMIQLPPNYQYGSSYGGYSGINYFVSPSPFASGRFPSPDFQTFGYGGNFGNSPYFESGCPTETGFGAFHSKEAVLGQWRPLIAYAYDAFQEYQHRFLQHRNHPGFERPQVTGMSSNYFNSPGTLPPGTELSVCPSSEWCEFSSGEVAIGRIIWNGWRGSCPFFMRPLQGAPRLFAVKIAFFVRAAMVAEVSLDICLSEAGMISGGGTTEFSRPSTSPGRALLDGRPGVVMDEQRPKTYGGGGGGGYTNMNGNYGYPTTTSYSGGAVVEFDGCDRRTAMFRSIFMIHRDNDEGFDSLLEDTILSVPGLTIRRGADQKNRISELYLRMSDRLQVVSFRDQSNNRFGASDIFSDIRNIQAAMTSPEEKNKKVMITYGELPMMLSQDTDRLPGCNNFFCPEIGVYRWIYQTKGGRQTDLRQRLYEAARGITKAFLEVNERPIPLGMILSPTINENSSYSGNNSNNFNQLRVTSGTTGVSSSTTNPGSTGTWNLHFLCDDFTSQNVRDEFAHRPVEVRKDQLFIQDAYPMLKATIAILMYCKVAASEQLPSSYFPTPFNAFGISKLFDEGTLIDMANYYEEQARDSNSNNSSRISKTTTATNLFSSNGNGNGNANFNLPNVASNVSFNPNNNNGNGILSSPGGVSYVSSNNIASPFNPRDKYDQGNSEYSSSAYLQRGGGDYLANAVQCAEQALSAIYQWNLSRSAQKLRARLDDLTPSWLQQSEMRPMELDARVWWVSAEAYEHRWKYLHMMLAFPGTPAYQQYLQMNGGIGGGGGGERGGFQGTGSYGGYPTSISSHPTELVYHNAYYYQQQSKAYHTSYRGAELEICSRLVSELDIRDSMVVSDVATRLVREGCEKWEDVMKLDEFLGEKSNFEEVRRFLCGLGIPVVFTAKLISSMRKFRGGNMF